jgi:mannose-6-phosphate isomerase-like protein (cupin superfamily)
MPGKKLRPAVSRAKTSRFARRGLRGYFEYRDVGVKRASGGKILAHVIRSRPGKAPHGDWHYHDCAAQFVYVLKGWVKMHYEGGKPMVLKKGDCFFQPPRIRHRELAHSSDLEMLEIVAPGNFKTYGVEP